MRLTPIALTLVLVPALSAGGASATDTGSLVYIAGGGVYTPETGDLAVSSCATQVPYLIVNILTGQDHPELNPGCIGGGLIFTSEAHPLFYVQGQLPEQMDATKYVVAHTITTDDLAGPNVQVTACLIATGTPGPYVCTPGRDAVAGGCGVTLETDATGLHAGNVFVLAFVYQLSVDASTTGVCLSTTGVTNVVFSNP